SIKKGYELNPDGNPVVFSKLNERGEPASNYSMLDALYVNVKHYGDYAIKVEVRQNANEQRKALTYITQQLGLPEEDVESPEKLLAAMESDRSLPARVQKLYEELDREFKAQPDKAQWKNDNENKFHAVQILGIFNLMKQYPGAIETYVIAEAATVDKDAHPQ